MEHAMTRPLAALTCAVLMAAAPALAQDAATEPAVAEARMMNTEGQEIGVLTLTQADTGVTIGGQLTGIPQGEHGFHIHEVGLCDPADDFESAGNHFSPHGRQHGFENLDGPHAGDLRNQTADANEMMTISTTNDMVSLIDGDEGYLLGGDGTALVVHAEPDDYRTDPSGNSGDRIACGVIEAVQN
jgi:superoxide dismutase, Cu-Zn family